MWAFTKGIGFWPSMRVAAAMAVGLPLAACSGAEVLNLLTPRDGYRLQRDIAYGAGARQKLDLYAPIGAADDGPIVVFFHGGGWESGAKDDYLFVAQALAARGYATVVPNYRLYPEVRYPAFLEDAAAALAWVRDYRRPSADPDRPVFLLGHSAGAYIAVTLALDQRWLRRAGVPLCDTVRGAIGLAGPYDFLPLSSARLKDIFGPPPGRPATQPINHVDGDEPPLLLIAGAADRTVRPGNSRRLAARVRERGGVAETRVYEAVGHIALVAAFSDPLAGVAPVRDDVAGFIERHRRDAPCAAQP